MIVQSLYKYYQKLYEAGKLPLTGWVPQKIGHVVNLDYDGNIESITSYMKSEAPIMMVPVGNNTTSGIEPSFLCDKAKYFFGAELTGSSKKLNLYESHFNASKELHHKRLDNVKSARAQAVLKFFDSWDPAASLSDKCISESSAVLDTNTTSKDAPPASIVFLVDGCYVHEDDAIVDMWNSLDPSEMVKTSGSGICLVSGREGPYALSHPNIKGFAGAQTSGAYMISSNKDAFCSYGMTSNDQGKNSRIGVDVALGYGLALNYIKDNFGFYIGQTMVLSWADAAEDEYVEMHNATFIDAINSKHQKVSSSDENDETEGESTDSSNDESFSSSDGEEKKILGLSEKDFQSAVHELARGRSVPVGGRTLDPNTNYYILGLAPNSARLSVQFFYVNSFGNIIRNVLEHQERLSISGQKKAFVSVQQILRAITNQKTKDKSVASNIAKGICEAIFNNSRYPATLLYGVMNRIRADHWVTPTRAGIIKAYYLKSNNPFVPKEVLTMALNKESTNVPYNLGRLFAVLESLQYAALKEVNSSIKDRFLNSAAEKPSMVFSRLLELSEKHLKKIYSGNGENLEPDNEGKKSRATANFYRNLIAEILSNIGETFPDRLNLAQQGSFMLGYYHQCQERRKNKDAVPGDTELDVPEIDE